MARCGPTTFLFIGSRQFPGLDRIDVVLHVDTQLLSQYYINTMRSLKSYALSIQRSNPPYLLASWSILRPPAGTTGDNTPMRHNTMAARLLILHREENVSHCHFSWRLFPVSVQYSTSCNIDFSIVTFAILHAVNSSVKCDRNADDTPSVWSLYQ